MKEKIVTLTNLMEQMKLKYCTPEIDLEDRFITIPEINRPALQLAGYFDHFMNRRVQIIGYVAYTYLMQKREEERIRAYEAFISRDVPCVVFTTQVIPGEELLELARKYQVPTFATERQTSPFTAEITRWLNVQLAPSISIHGVLIDVYGEGILIMGESGIGKSETALELVKRGHRLVSDDVVEISRVSDITLVGTAPDITRHFIELRGIGILDARQLYGVEAIKTEQQIDMVISLEVWNPDKQYDRLGLNEKTMNILGNKVISYNIPIRPGRNLAVIAETAAINHRQKKMGYNAAKELGNRVMGNIARRRREIEENE